MKQDKSTKPNFIVRGWKKLCKFCSDTKGELRKVVWTPKEELKKSSRLVIVTCIAICLAIAIIDTGASKLINLLAGLVG